MKEKEILPLVTTWMNLADIRLNEISRHRRTNIVPSYLYVETKKPNLQNQSRMIVTRSRG